MNIEVQAFGSKEETLDREPGDEGHVVLHITPARYVPLLPASTFVGPRANRRSISNDSAFAVTIFLLVRPTPLREPLRGHVFSSRTHRRAVGTHTPQAD